DLTDLEISDGGVYTVTVSNMAGVVESEPAVLSGENPVPVIETQPLAATATAGAQTILSVTASGTGGLTYQWRKDGITIPGATEASYTITSPRLADSGYYDVLVNDGLS